MRVAAFQFDVQRSAIEENLAVVESGLRRAADDGIRLVCLPEMWPTSFVHEGEAECVPESEEAVRRLGELSRELDLVVAGTAFAAGPADGGELPRNRMHVFDAGELVLSYDKVHLHSPTAEPQSFSAGERLPGTVDTSVGRLSGGVCYDLRFGSFFEEAHEQGAELLLLCAQWPSPRASHWTALVRGRSVLNQCTVVAANRCGTDRVGRRRMELEFPGNSLIADADGTVLAEGRGQAGLVAAELDPELARRLRVSVPIGKDRRPGLY